MLFWGPRDWRMVVLAIDPFNGFTSYNSLASAAIHQVPLAFQIGFLTWLTPRALFGIAAMRPSVVDAIPLVTFGAFDFAKMAHSTCCGRLVRPSFLAVPLFSEVKIIRSTDSERGGLGASIAHRRAARSGLGRRGAFHNWQVDALQYRLTGASQKFPYEI